MRARSLKAPTLKQIKNIAIKENLILSRKSSLFEHVENLEKDLNTDLAQKIMERSKPIADKFEEISRKEQVYISKRSDDIEKKY